MPQTTPNDITKAAVIYGKNDKNKPKSDGGEQKVIGAQSIGPQTIGPQSIGPQSIGPQSKGPQSIGPQLIGPQLPQELATQIQGKSQEEGAKSKELKRPPIKKVQEPSLVKSGPKPLLPLVHYDSDSEENSTSR